MAKIIGHLALLAVAACLMVLQATIVLAVGSNVFHVRSDTVTVKPGDTAIVNVFYTFDSAHSHNIQGFTAHLLYDTNEVLIDYMTAGTASAGFWDTIGSRHGFAAFSTLGQELDLTNPILFRMRVFVNKTLGDTAFIRWDSTFPLFNDASYGVDSVVEQDGWVRPVVSKGHVMLSIPGDSLMGRYHDSVAFSAPVVISDVSGAKLSKVQFRFVFDARYLFFRGASAGPETRVDSIREGLDAIRGYDTVWLILSSKSLKPLVGADTLVNLDLSAIAFAGWNCTSLWAEEFKPLNSGALVGNVDVRVDTFCVFGSLERVEPRTGNAEGALQLFPNPATTAVRFEGVPFNGTTNFEVFDAAGRRVDSGSLPTGEWNVPPHMAPGAYRVVIRDFGSREQRWMGSLMIAPR